MADFSRLDRTLAVTRANFRAPLEARGRVRAGLAASGQLGARGAADASHATPRLASAPGMGKSTAAALAGLAFVAGYWLGGQRAGEPTPPRAPSASLTDAPSTSPPAQSPGLASEVSAITEAAPRMERPAPPGAGALLPLREQGEQPPASKPPGSKRRASPAQSEPRNGASSGELALLQRAERALRSGEPELALSFLDDIERRYPETRLGEERTAARLMARCARADAHVGEQARQFLQSHRASVYSDRVAELCGLTLDATERDGIGSAGH